MTTLEAARELLKLTAILEDAVATGDTDAAQRLLAARARVIEETSSTRLGEAEAAALEELAVQVRASETRVRATLGRAIAQARSGLAVLTMASAAAHVYVRPEGLPAGFVDRRD